MPSCFSWAKKQWDGEWQATRLPHWKWSLTQPVYIIYSPQLLLPAEYRHTERLVKTTSGSVCWPKSRAKKCPKNQLKSHIFCGWKDYAIIRKHPRTLLINLHRGITHRETSIFSCWHDVNAQCLSLENKGWKKLAAALEKSGFLCT